MPGLFNNWSCRWIITALLHEAHITNFIRYTEGLKFGRNACDCSLSRVVMATLQERQHEAPLSLSLSLCASKMKVTMQRVVKSDQTGAERFSHKPDKT